MSTTALHEAASATDKPLANLLFDYPGADIILRSQDYYHFQVPKIYIANSSPVLGELIQSALDSPGVADVEASLPVVQVPKRGKILHFLLTIIFPINSLVPSSPEEILELLSDAQTYQMDFVLTHIRDRIARQNSLPTRLEPALRIYSLAQKYGLRQEALQTARTILNYPMTIEEYDGKLDIMSGASLYELWNYHERVRAILGSDLPEFRMSRARDTITDLRCTELSSSQIPSWLDQYIESIGKSPNLFDSTELNIAMTRHIKDMANKHGCECASIPGRTIRDFWEALASVVDGSFEKASTVDIPS
jgi:BTB/POZ domain